MDPVRELVHDHGEINRHVLGLGAMIREAASARPSLVASLGVLRDLLFTHFAREEEGVFPFVASTFADLAPRVHAMEVAHDAICGALARMHALASSGGVEGLAALFARFESAYAEHAASEAALFESLDGRLDAAQRARLAALVDGL